MERINNLIEELKESVQERLLFEDRAKKYWIGPVVKKMRQKGTTGALRKMLGVPAGKSIPDVYSPSELLDKYEKGSTLLKRRIIFAMNVGKATGQKFWKTFYNLLKKRRKKVKESEEEFLANLILEYEDLDDVIGSLKENFYIVPAEVQKTLIEVAKVKLKKVGKGTIYRKLGLKPDVPISKQIDATALARKAKTTADKKLSRAIRMVAALRKKKDPYWKKVFQYLEVK